jgi:hypothetical protein
LRTGAHSSISIVEIFNNGNAAMGTMNFSIPDDVKDAFNKAFDGQNKSAVVTGLMRKALEDVHRTKKGDALLAQMRKLQAMGPTYTDAEICVERRKGRP